MTGVSTVPGQHTGATMPAMWPYRGTPSTENIQTHKVKKRALGIPILCFCPTLAFVRLGTERVILETVSLCPEPTQQHAARKPLK